MEEFGKLAAMEKIIDIAKRIYTLRDAAKTRIFLTPCEKMIEIMSGINMLCVYAENICKMVLETQGEILKRLPFIVLLEWSIGNLALILVKYTISPLQVQVSPVKRKTHSPYEPQNTFCTTK
jgi:hypothetical protein